MKTNKISWLMRRLAKPLAGICGILVVGGLLCPSVMADEPRVGEAPIVGGGNISIEDMHVVKAAQFAVKARQETMKAEGKTDKITLVKIVKASSRAIMYKYYDLELQVKAGEKTETAKVGVYRGYSAKYELAQWNDERFPVKEQQGGSKDKEISVNDPSVVKAMQYAVKARQEEIGKSATIKLIKIVEGRQRTPMEYEVYDIELEVKIGSATGTAGTTVARWPSGDYELIEWVDY